MRPAELTDRITSTWNRLSKLHQRALPGIADPAAAPTWAGMQHASLKTHAKVQYLSITGPATVANASPFLNTLIAFDCAVIVAAGDLPTKTVVAQAGAHTKQPFILIGASDGHPNVTSVATNDVDLSKKVSKLVAAEVSGKT